MERDTQPFAEARTQSIDRVLPREKHRSRALPVLFRDFPEDTGAQREFLSDTSEEKTDPRAEGACLFDLSPLEWRLVRNAPVVSFLIVAGADGTVHPREQRALVSALEQGKRSSCELFRAVCRELYRQRDGLMGVFVSDTYEDAQLSEAYRLITENLGQDEAERFKACLLMLGWQVAKASGGLGASWGWVRSVERRAVAKLAAAFGASAL
jgi:hypothetical protein